MIQATPHQKFLLLVQTGAIVRDIQTSRMKAVEIVAHVMDIDAKVFMDYEDDMASLAHMAQEYIAWRHDDGPRPKWIEFYNGALT